MSISFSSEATYVALLLGLFVLPAFLRRWSIPSGITAFFLGVIAGPGFGAFQHDQTITLISTLGIVSLFLFAGLEIERDELAQEAHIIGEHLVIRAAAIVVVAYLISLSLALGFASSVLIALAILTPSTGFILDSLPRLGLSSEAQFWVRAKAIATEILALGAMFIAIQSGRPLDLIISASVLIALTITLPHLFAAFVRFIRPYAPDSEFAFLIVVAAVCAFVTKELGVYYLVGALLAGVTAQRFRERAPAMTSERLLKAVESFSSIFVPFYFFHAGLEVQTGDMSLAALAFGVLLLTVGIPLRIGLVAVHRRVRLGEGAFESAPMAVAMLPTLVFALVIVQLLRERAEVPAFVIGGIIVYALVSTSLPAMLLRAPVADFETPEVPPPPPFEASPEMAVAPLPRTLRPPVLIRRSRTDPVANGEREER